MKYLRSYIRQLLKESLEEEGIFDSMFASGEWSSINQAISLSEDMGMDILELPWDRIQVMPSMVDLIKDEKELSLRLAELVLNNFPTLETTIRDKLENLYQLATKHGNTDAQGQIGMMSLHILKSVKASRGGS